MNNMIPAHQAEKGLSYRLFPSGKRSRHIVAQFLGISPKNHPIFLFTDPETSVTVLITDVGLTESIQEIGTEIVDIGLN